MLALLPPSRISPMTGLAQAGDVAGARFGAGWLSPCFALLISVGVLGQLNSYIAAKLRVAVRDGAGPLLPLRICKVHPRWRTPYVSILAQGVWLNHLPVAGGAGREPARRIPDHGGHDGDRNSDSVRLHFHVTASNSASAGLGPRARLVSAIAIVLSAIPPPGVASVWLFELKVVGGTLLLVLAGRVILRAQSGCNPRMTYSESVRFLYSLGKRDSTAKFGLEQDHASAGSPG